MADQTAPDILAGLLDIQPDEAQRLLDRFAGGMTAELLDRSRLSVDGLGSFSVVHEQPVRESGADGTRYLPPRNRVEFTPRAKGSDDTAAIASARLDMAADEAQRFAQALSGMFGQLSGSASGLELRGFGSFAAGTGTFRFQPDGSLDELLNIGYGDLKEIVIPEQTAVEAGSAAPERSGMMKLVALLVVALLLLVGGWLLYRHVAPGSVETGSAPAPSASVSAVEEKPESAPRPEAPQAGSLLLRKGRYTVIVATFSSKNGAKQEWRRLSELGHQLRVWPVKSGGDRYYRLVTGDFGSVRAARDSMKSMPKGLPSHSYIQQAPKNVVLYGEEGL
ncbi:MAG: SPOR domain-containing protein [Chlorobiaceae bacterium]|nr:SPOR domain-containing protein [Chlorobiaceae bacterium]